MKRSAWHGRAFIVLLLLALASCTPGGPPREARRGGAFELRIGGLLSITGEAGGGSAEPAEQLARIAEALIDETLERTGLADRISVTVVALEDDQSEARAGVEAATKLVHADRVDVIVGAQTSAVTIPVAQSVTIPEQIVLISPSSTAPPISDLDDRGLVWRTAPSDVLQAEILAEAMRVEFGPHATVNTGARNDAYGAGLTDLFEEAWRRQGGVIGRSVRWNPAGPTFDTEAQELAEGDPDAWMIIDFPGTWAQVGPALVRTGNWDPDRTFTADGLWDPALPQTAGTEATEGLRGTAPTSVEAPARDALDRTVKARAPPGSLLQRFGVQGFGAHAFDAIILAFLAALRGGSSEPEVIAQHLRSVSGPGGTKYTFEDLDAAVTDLTEGRDIDYEGASGPIDFDEKGDPSVGQFEIWQFRNGQIEVVKVLTTGT